MTVSLIILLITGGVLFRQQRFNSSTLLRSLAYSVALSVRQAQVYGISVRESAAGSNLFAPGYGAYFSSGDMVHYSLFADTLPAPNGGDGQYQSGEELPRYTVGNGRGTDYKISNFCAHANSGDQCVSGTSPTITWMVVYFRRPNTDACVATDQNPGACAAGASPVYSYAHVTLTSAGSTDSRSVKVTSTGQIAVCRLNADVSAC